MADGDNLLLGNGNDAQTPTVIEARVRDGVSFFDLGRAIFEAGPSAPPDIPADPFMGVLGRGNDCPKGYDRQGMPGVAGYGGRPGFKNMDSQQGGCGVMGIGGCASDEQTHPAGPGPGIYGMGGISGNNNGAGVIGDSGISDLQGVPDNGVGVPFLPSFAETQNIGVYGRSQNGPGVAGTSYSDRGGIFSSGSPETPTPTPVAQMRLVPQPLSPSPNPPAGLPTNGKPGDFFTTMIVGDIPRAELWFCIGQASNNPANPGVRWGLVAFSTTQDV